MVRPYARSRLDRKSTRLNSSHQIISYAVFCLKKKNLPARSRQFRLEPEVEVSRSSRREAGAVAGAAGVDLRRVEFDGVVFFFNDTATTEIYTLSLHDALPI